MTWISDKTKSRRCDHCLDDPAVTKKLDRCKKERKARLTNNFDLPLQVGLSKTEVAKKVCEVRDKLADIKQQKLDDEFCGDL
jgi:hypothetical protein